MTSFEGGQFVLRGRGRGKSNTPLCLVIKCRENVAGFRDPEGRSMEYLHSPESVTPVSIQSVPVRAQTLGSHDTLGRKCTLYLWKRWHMITQAVKHILQKVTRMNKMRKTPIYSPIKRGKTERILSFWLLCYVTTDFTVAVKSFSSAHHHQHESCQLKTCENLPHGAATHSSAMLSSGSEPFRPLTRESAQQM